MSPVSRDARSFFDQTPEFRIVPDRRRRPRIALVEQIGHHGGLSRHRRDCFRLAEILHLAAVSGQHIHRRAQLIDHVGIYRHAISAAQITCDPAHRRKRLPRRLDVARIKPIEPLPRDRADRFQGFLPGLVVDKRIRRVIAEPRRQGRPLRHEIVEFERRNSDISAAAIEDGLPVMPPGVRKGVVERAELAGAGLLRQDTEQDRSGQQCGSAPGKHDQPAAEISPMSQCDVRICPHPQPPDFDFRRGYPLC
jgi:hypothetical protein